MSYAIFTKFISPASKRGARISVSSTFPNKPRKFYAWDYEKSVEDNHKLAAKYYLIAVIKANPHALLVGAVNKESTGYIWIQADSCLYI